MTWIIYLKNIYHGYCLLSQNIYITGQWTYWCGWNAEDTKIDSCADEDGFTVVYPTVELVPRIPLKRQSPLNREDIALYMDDAGRVENPQSLKQRIFEGVGYKVL